MKNFCRNLFKKSLALIAVFSILSSSVPSQIGYDVVPITEASDSSPYAMLTKIAGTSAVGTQDTYTGNGDVQVFNGPPFGQDTMVFTFTVSGSAEVDSAVPDGCSPGAVSAVSVTITCGSAGFFNPGVTVLITGTGTYTVSVNIVSQDYPAQNKMLTTGPVTVIDPNATPIISAIDPISFPYDPANDAFIRFECEGQNGNSVNTADVSASITNGTITNTTLTQNAADSVFIDVEFTSPGPSSGPGGSFPAVIITIDCEDGNALTSMQDFTIDMSNSYPQLFFPNPPQVSEPKENFPYAGVLPITGQVADDVGDTNVGVAVGAGTHPALTIGNFVIAQPQIDFEIDFSPASGLVVGSFPLFLDVTDSYASTTYQFTFTVTDNSGVVSNAVCFLTVSGIPCEDAKPRDLIDVGSITTSFDFNDADGDTYTFSNIDAPMGFGFVNPGNVNNGANSIAYTVPGGYEFSQGDTITLTLDSGLTNPSGNPIVITLSFPIGNFGGGRPRVRAREEDPGPGQLVNYSDDEPDVLTGSTDDDTLDEGEEIPTEGGGIYGAGRIGEGFCPLTGCPLTDSTPITEQHQNFDLVAAENIAAIHENFFENSYQLVLAEQLKEQSEEETVYIDAFPYVYIASDGGPVWLGPGGVYVNPDPNADDDDLAGVGTGQVPGGIPGTTTTGTGTTGGAGSGGAAGVGVGGAAGIAGGAGIAGPPTTGTATGTGGSTGQPGTPVGGSGSVPGSSDEVEQPHIRTVNTKATDRKHRLRDTSEVIADVALVARDNTSYTPTLFVLVKDPVPNAFGEGEVGMLANLIEETKDEEFQNNTHSAAENSGTEKSNFTITVSPNKEILRPGEVVTVDFIADLADGDTGKIEARIPKTYELVEGPTTIESAQNAQLRTKSGGVNETLFISSPPLFENTGTYRFRVELRALEQKDNSTKAPISGFLNLGEGGMHKHDIEMSIISGDSDADVVPEGTEQGSGDGDGLSEGAISDPVISVEVNNSQIPERSSVSFEIVPDGQNDVAYNGEFIDVRFAIDVAENDSGIALMTLSNGLNIPNRVLREGQDVSLEARRNSVNTEIIINGRKELQPGRYRINLRLQIPYDYTRNQESSVLDGSGAFKLTFRNDEVKVINPDFKEPTVSLPPGVFAPSSTKQDGPNDLGSTINLLLKDSDLNINDDVEATISLKVAEGDEGSMEINMTNGYDLEQLQQIAGAPVTLTVNSNKGGTLITSNGVIKPGNYVFEVRFISNIKNSEGQKEMSAAFRGKGGYLFDREYFKIEGEIEGLVRSGSGENTARFTRRESFPTRSGIDIHFEDQNEQNILTPNQDFRVVVDIYVAEGDEQGAYFELPKSLTLPGEFYTQREVRFSPESFLQIIIQGGNLNRFVINGGQLLDPGTYTFELYSKAPSLNGINGGIMLADAYLVPNGASDRDTVYLEGYELRGSASGSDESGVTDTSTSGGDNEDIESGGSATSQGPSSGGQEAGNNEDPRDEETIDTDNPSKVQSLTGIPYDFTHNEVVEMTAKVDVSNVSAQNGAEVVISLPRELGFDVVYQEEPVASNFSKDAYRTASENYQRAVNQWKSSIYNIRENGQRIPRSRIFADFKQNGESVIRIVRVPSGQMTYEFGVLGYVIGSDFPATHLGKVVNTSVRLVASSGGGTMSVQNKTKDGKDNADCDSSIQCYSGCSAGGVHEVRTCSDTGICILRKKEYCSGECSAAQYSNFCPNNAPPTEYFDRNGEPLDINA